MDNRLRELKDQLSALEKSTRKKVKHKTKHFGKIEDVANNVLSIDDFKDEITKTVNIFLDKNNLKPENKLMSEIRELCSDIITQRIKN